MADQRTGELREVIYADSQTVLSRDGTDATTPIPRRAFERALGTRYRARPNADSHIDGGQYERLRARLAEYDGRDGRKARHKADALREALDLLAATPADGTGRENDEEIAFEGIGPKTASTLRSQGIVTAADVDAVNGWHLP